jgi:hypothetical protein
MTITIDSLRQRQSTDFEHDLKHSLENLPSGTLPLEKGTSQGGYVDDSDISVTIINISEAEDHILAKVGIFFTEIVVGCGCGDDPLPVNTYCEMLVNIETGTATANFEVIQA